MRSLLPREKRLFALLTIAVSLVAWDLRRRHWSHDIVQETEHYTIYSTATPEQTREISMVAEIVYSGYFQFLEQLKLTNSPHERLKVKLFKDRDEFKRCNRVKTWAEGFYQKPYCYQYYSATELNPYHWMMHEATHQLNEEAARLTLPKWLNEGIADYLGSSRIISNKLCLGIIDTNTYPVWWLHSMAVSGNFKDDTRNLSIIPLRAIISGRGGPDINTYFNLYYLHWWSLMHFLMQGHKSEYRGGLSQLMKYGADVPAFERNIGRIEDVEMEWYMHVLDLKKAVAERSSPPVILRLKKQIERP